MAETRVYFLLFSDTTDITGWSPQHISRWHESGCLVFCFQEKSRRWGIDAYKAPYDDSSFVVNRFLVNWFLWTNEDRETLVSGSVKFPIMVWLSVEGIHQKGIDTKSRTPTQHQTSDWSPLKNVRGANITKFLGSPVRAKSPCPLFVVRGWLLRGMVFEFMKIHARSETSVSRRTDCICFYDGQRTTDNGQAKPENGSETEFRERNRHFSVGTN